MENAKNYKILFEDFVNIDRRFITFRESHADVS